MTSLRTAVGALAFVLIGAGCSSESTVDDTAVDLDGGRVDADATSSPDTGSRVDATGADTSSADRTVPTDSPAGPDGSSPEDAASESASAEAAAPAIRWIGRFDLAKPSQP